MTWTIVAVDPGRPGNVTINSPVLARAPGCPETRHPTRDCGCKVFRTRAAAAVYVASRETPA